MIAVTFLVRIVQFLLSVVVAGCLLYAVYYVVSRMFMWTIDRIADSNRDFFVWLRSKWPFNSIVVRRKNKS